MDNIYIKSSAFGYKGAELSTPEVNKSLERLLTYKDDLDYNIVSIIDPGICDGLNYDQTISMFNKLSDEDKIKGFWRVIDAEIEDLYASEGESIVEYFKLHEHDSKLRVTELSVKSMKELCDSEILLKFINND